jgi:hypothetical protein
MKGPKPTTKAILWQVRLRAVVCHGLLVKLEETSKIVVLSDRQVLAGAPINEAPEVLFNSIPLAREIVERNDICVAWMGLPTPSEKGADVGKRMTALQSNFRVIQI